MSIKIILSNSESIFIEEKTRIYAWKSDDKDSKFEGYYSTLVFEGSWFDGTEIGTSDQIVGLQGLFGNSDWFAINDMAGKIYKTSSIVSLEDF